MAKNGNRNASEVQQPINLCRCCLAEGCYKDISTEYFTNGQKEVYAVMLLETFNLSISYQEGGGPSSESRLICDDCITTLRDSYKFKKMVLYSEETFKERLERLRKPSEMQIEIKIEEEMDGSSDDFNAASDNDDVIIVDDSLSSIKIEGCKTEPFNFTSEDESALIIEEEPAKKRRSTRKRIFRTEEGQVVTKNSTSARGLIQDFQEPPMGPSCSETPTKGKRRFRSPSRQTTSNSKRLKEKKATISNTMRLIQYSNMCPFRWNLQYQYKCFCCEKMFRDNIKNLKAHTRSKHVIEEIEDRISRHYNSLHNVDISSLGCNECGEQLSDITELRKHLSERHSVTIEPVESILVPFKLEEDTYRCVLCPEEFQYLHSFNIHMNTHFKNFVCHVCGAGFRCSNRMNMHMKRHKDKQHKCETCGLTFASLYKKQKHDVAVHNKSLRMKCPQCSERFAEYYARQAHQIKVHNMEQPKHECEFCQKQYLFKHRLKEHIRRDHLKEKNHECDECGLKFFAKDMLKRHMISHNGEKIHECTFCKKSYARRGTLREHMKIHLNIRKWVCNVCGEAFVQNCSLKNHLKKHRQE